MTILMEDIIQYLPHIFTGSAVIISIISFYYLHFRASKLRFEYLTKEEKSLTNHSSTTYEYIISVINEGNKTGIIKKITSESTSEVEIKRLETNIYRGEKGYKIGENEPFAVIGIEPKESIVIKSKFRINKPKAEASKYFVKIVIDKKGKFEKLSEKDKKELMIERE